VTPGDILHRVTCSEKLTSRPCNIPLLRHAWTVVPKGVGCYAVEGSGDARMRSAQNEISSETFQLHNEIFFSCFYREPVAELQRCEM
jgi:hypothetical protein